MMRQIVASAALVASCNAAILSDLVPTLPGFGAPPTTWYSGYLNVPGGKHMHYIFIEGPQPQTNPVTAWFNGGPGCSSLEGLFAELGQLLVDEQNPSTLKVNPFSWSNISNTLFIEAPACVGYSYADTIDGCTHNDTTQAVDNYNALLVFFAGYPEFSKNDFFITGESYAGIYVPTLAKQVVLGNAAGNPIIYLKGIAVGNGCLGLHAGLCSFNDGVEINTNVPYFRGHGLISSTTYEQFQADCPVGTDPANPSAACQADIAQAHAEVGDVNIYDIYAPCIDGPSNTITDSKSKLYTRAPVPRRFGGPIECIDETISVYIGSNAVATALNVIPSLHWAVCGSNSSFNYIRTEADERIDVYPTIVAAGVRVLIYNGDADACVPFIDNEWWTRSMNYTVVNPWHSWSVATAADGVQLAGYAVNYENGFTFATVKGAGHMVPQFAPEAAWSMFNTFVTGGTF